MAGVEKAELIIKIALGADFGKRATLLWPELASLFIGWLTVTHLAHVELVHYEEFAPVFPTSPPKLTTTHHRNSRYIPTFCRPRYGCTTTYNFKKTRNMKRNAFFTNQDRSPV
jgi:hypothetical protein